MTAAICSCLSDAGPWAGRDEPGIPPAYTQTLRAGCAVHGAPKGPKPYYERGGITIYHGDCREILPTLDFAVIVTDPPYGIDSEVSTTSKRIEGDVDLYLRDWVVANTGCPSLIFGSPKLPRPDDCVAVLIWDKGELVGMGDLNFPWKLTHEEIYVTGIGFKAVKRTGSVLHFPLRMAWTKHPDAVLSCHPTEKPVGLMRALLEACPDGVILDPFMGSGTTLRAAKDLGRKAIGIEIEEKYCEIVAKRLSQEVLL